MACEVGGLTIEQARQNLIRYFVDSYTLPHDVIYPQEKEPDLESRSTPFILLNIIAVSKEQAGMGLRDLITDKYLDIALWKKEFTGIKDVAEFEDFVDSLSLTVVEGIVYKEPKSPTEKTYKGWVVNSILLPFKF